MAFDNDTLVTQIKIKGSIADGRYTDAELLELAWNQLSSVIYPLIISMREEYFVRDHDTAVVAQQQAYPITDRALGDVLREVKLIVGEEIRDLPRLDPEDITSTAAGEPRGFFLQGNNIMLYPKPATATGTVRQSYYIAPGKLVETSYGAQILTITAATNTVTIGTLPTGWTTANAFDFQKGKAGHEYLGIDYVASLVSTTMTFTTTMPTTLAVGDWLVLSKEAVLPQIPEQSQPLLAQSTATMALKAMGHNEGAMISSETEKSLASGSGVIMAGRIQGAPRRSRTTLL